MSERNLEALSERERACLTHLRQAQELGASFSRYCREKERKLHERSWAKRAWIRKGVIGGRGYDAVKILSWDRNGFAVWWKKIESDEKFHWPSLLQEDVITLTAEQLNWLLDGYDVWAAPHRMIKFTHVS